MNLDCLEKFFGWQPQWSAVTAGCLHTWMPQPVRFKERGNTSALLLTCSAHNTIGYGAFVNLNKKKIIKKNQDLNITLELLQSCGVLFNLSFWKLNFTYFTNDMMQPSLRSYDAMIFIMSNHFQTCATHAAQVTKASYVISTAFSQMQWQIQYVLSCVNAWDTFLHKILSWLLNKNVSIIFRV